MRRTFLAAALIGGSILSGGLFGADFIRGDANQDGDINISDPIAVLLYLFNSQPSTCLDALDISGEGEINISDPIFFLTFLFIGGITIPAPYPGCGPDLTVDALDCKEFNLLVCPQSSEVAITAVTPEVGLLGTTIHVAIQGKGFSGTNSQTTLCDQALLNVTVTSDTQIEADVPASSVRKTCALRISNSKGEAILHGAFSYEEGSVPEGMVVLGYNDLGMHCMNQDFSEMMILPPYNTLHAQIIDRRGGEDPRIVTSGVTVTYTMLDNTQSAPKTNFWTYAKALLGLPAPLTLDMGLAGNGLTGTMTATTSGDWQVLGIPVTPISDSGVENPYQMASIRVMLGGTEVARTEAVTPVSWEINCDLCHKQPGVSTAADILQKHDALHQTDLSQKKPVLCGGCHAQPPLGLSGDPLRKSLSRSMHGAHATRMGPVVDQLGGVACYACHPGIRTQCLRDVHFAKGMNCMTCHASMEAVADPARQPWADEPRCGSPACHIRAGFEFEQAGTLYRNSLGHHSVHCAACHGSPHAITPTVKARDNLQALSLQGEVGKIKKCTVCHTEQPSDPFPHNLSGDDG